MQRRFPIAVWLPSYQWGKFFRADLIAAVSVAALLIPESMGYATVAGVPLQIGLYMAPLALVGYAMFGGSKVLVFAAAGSVAAISASVIGEVSGGGGKDAAAALIAALALTTGAIFLVAGWARMGWITNFMSKAVMGGFITGMAIQIIVGQFGNLFGVDVEGGDSFAKLWSWISQIGDWNVIATVIGLGALGSMFAIQRFVPKLPAALTAVVLTSLIVAGLDPDIDLVKKIPEGLPSIGTPSGISASDWLTLLAGGAVVALVGFSEGWGASAQISKTTHDQLNSNQEFIAYGVGNIGAGLSGGMPGTGSLSKSSAALSVGAKSQMANILLAGIVLLTLAFFAPLFQWLPETVLAAIVINAMWGSAGPQKLQRLWYENKIDFALGLLTGFLVLALDLLPAMIVGIAFSIVYMVYRVSFPGQAVLGRVAETGDYEATAWQYGRRRGAAHPDAKPVPGVIVYRFAAPLIFSNAEAFVHGGESLLIEAGAKGSLPGTLVVDCEEMFTVDATGASVLGDLGSYCGRYGVELKLARLHSGARRGLELAGVVDEIGEEAIYDTVRDAVEAAGSG
jgi:high affinity sulfate transporter 1